MKQKILNIIFSIDKCIDTEDNFSTNVYVYHLNYKFKKIFCAYQIVENSKINFPKKLIAVDLLHSINFIYQGEINDQN